MTHDEYTKVIEKIRSDLSYRGQLILLNKSKFSSSESFDIKGLSSNEYDRLLKSGFEKLKRKEFCGNEQNIFNKIISQEDLYIVNVNDKRVKFISDLSILFNSFYFGRKFVILTLEKESTITRLHSMGSIYLELHHLIVSGKSEEEGNDILIIHPSELINLFVNQKNNSKYPSILDFNSIVIENIQLYNCRELNHLVQLINKIKDSRNEYGLNPDDLQIILSSTPVENRKEIANLFFNTISDDAILFDDDTPSNDFQFCYWKPALQTDSRVETADKIKISKDSTYDELLILLKSIKASGVRLKILLWVNEIGLSNDFNLNLLKNIIGDVGDATSKLDIQTVNRLESLDYDQYYTFDIVIAINPAKISGYFIEQCGKLVSDMESIVIMLLGDDHLSHQLLRSHEYSLYWENEDFNLPKYFILNSSVVEDFYKAAFNGIKNLYSNLYKQIDRGQVNGY